MAVKAAPAEPYVIIQCFQNATGEDVDDAVVFFGNKDECEKRFLDYLSDGDNCYYAMAKIIQDAEPEYRINTFPEE